MGCWTLEGPCAKGPILYWLDRCSLGAGARERLAALLDAIAGLGPTYQGLENVLDTYLAAPLGIDSTVRQRVLEHLRDHWFNDGPAAYFPGQNVAQKWAHAAMKTIELSLSGKPHPVPIDAWWLIRPETHVWMMNFAEVRNGVTVSGSVILLIQTPRTPKEGAPSTRAIWGDAEAWITELEGETVVTRQIEKEPRPSRRS